ncbi:MAG: CbiM family transporter [Leptospirillia bacterium]
MHISDGVLSGPVLAAGWAATGVLATVTMRKMDMEEVPKLAVIAGVFFVASLIRFPIGAASVHLILNGLVGVVLGKRAFPAILLGLILQAILFGHGGVSVIGINAIMLGGGALVAYGFWQFRRILGSWGIWMMALFAVGGAVLTYHAFFPLMSVGFRGWEEWAQFLLSAAWTAFLVVSVYKKNVDAGFGGLAAAIGVLSSGLVLAATLVTTGDAFMAVAKAVIWIHVMVMMAETLVVGACVNFLIKVRPDMLSGWRPSTSPQPSTTAPPVLALVLAAALMAALLAPATAHAHKLLVDYTATKDGLLIEAFFPDGKPAMDIPVRLMTPEGDLVDEARTNDKGGYLFAVPARSDYVADADAQMGHFAEVEIPADELEGISFGTVSTVSAAELAPDVSKVKKEDIPVGRIIIGFLVLAAVGGGAVLMSKRGKNAS